MFLKFLALFLILEICLAIPVEDAKNPVGLPPSGSSPHPQKPDNSDLKTDPSTWWHTYYHHNYPVQYYHVQRVPHYTYWHY